MKKLLLSSVGMFAVATTFAVAANREDTKPLKDVVENTQVFLAGTVKSVDKDDNEFVLSYGGKDITVKTDEVYRAEDNKSAADYLVTGESVTVSGLVDKHLFSDRTIDASAIYTRTGHTLHSVADEDTGMFYSFKDIQDGQIYLVGQVSSIEKDESFTLDYGSGQITVETKAMFGNPLHSTATDPLLIGEYVQVAGFLEDGIFKEREVDAYRIKQLEYPTDS